MTIKKVNYLAASLLLFSLSSNAQHFSLSRLFYPNVTLRADYISPASASTNQEYGLSRTGMMALVPLQSEVDVSFSFKKKIDLRARHTFLVANFSQLTPTNNGITTPENGFKTASVGAVMLHASIRDKVWIYGGGLGVTESNETFFTPQPYLWGGGARMHIMGLNTQILYGSILTFSQKVRVIPIFGFNKKLDDNWRISGLLPFQANGNYKINDMLNVDLIAALNGYTAGYQQISGSEKIQRRSNYQHLKISAAANAHLFTVLNVSLEAGITAARQLRSFNSGSQMLTNQNPGIAPYLGVSVRYMTSKSKISSQFMGKMGLGGSGSGVNW